MVSLIEQQVNIAVPLGQAARRLRSFFRAHGNAEGDTSKIDLRIALHVPALPVPIFLRRSVIVTIQPQRMQSALEPRYDVQWAPAIPGPFPLFAGELFTVGDDDYTSFTLVLRGNYAPPLGLLGKFFDSAVGGLVARSTARDLLVRIRDFAEREFQDDERRDAGLRREATTTVATPGGGQETADA